MLGIYNCKEKFTRTEMNKLTYQFKSAAMSIPANIAESYAKFGLKEKVYFCIIDQSSKEECQCYQILSAYLGYGKNTDFGESLIEIYKLFTTDISRVNNNYKLLTSCP